MKTLIIGHRGTGKTTLLMRVQCYYRKLARKVDCFDLDSEIERRTQKTVSEIFTELGETRFRELEKTTFHDLELQLRNVKSDVYVSVGGGFDPGLAENDWCVLWLRRSTDKTGRIFTDRPRLDRQVSALDEYKERFEFRQERFKKRAEKILWLDEGAESGENVERDFLLGGFTDLKGAITVQPQHFRTSHALENWIHTRVTWGVRWFELRDDLLTAEEMRLAASFIPVENVLISFRDPKQFASTSSLVKDESYGFDWPLEQGPCPLGAPRFLSLHERLPGQSLKEALSRFPKEVPHGTQLKAALPTQDFHELSTGHEWMTAFREARVFLPLSGDGRWSWYRLWKGSRMDLNFFREGDGSGADQPTLLQWARRRRIEKSGRLEDLKAAPRKDRLFAAVLGDPVSHSRTPFEQAGFFARCGASTFAIRMTEEEMRGGALSVLCRFGLRWAAVTSPLKKAAFALAVVQDPAAQDLGAINTLMWNSDTHEWLGTNTDQTGLTRALREVRERAPTPIEKIAVWGGGGTLGAIESAVDHALQPQALEFFSVRQRENRASDRVRIANYFPDTVIWASGDANAAQVCPSSWSPRLVIDLNYAESSSGREYALKVGCPYISGLSMFHHQAEAQREFWGRLWDGHEVTGVNVQDFAQGEG